MVSTFGVRAPSQGFIVTAEPFQSGEGLPTHRATSSGDRKPQRGLAYVRLGASLPASSSLQRASDHRQEGRVAFRVGNQAHVGYFSHNLRWAHGSCLEAVQDRASFVFLDAAGSI